MITLHFEVSNYSEDFITLSLCAENEILTSEQIRKDCWVKDENNVQDYWRFVLISRIRKKIENWNPKYELPKDIYGAWYKWFYYIDEEVSLIGKLLLIFSIWVFLHKFGLKIAIK